MAMTTGETTGFDDVRVALRVDARPTGVDNMFAMSFALYEVSERVLLATRAAPPQLER